MSELLPCDVVMKGGITSGVIYPSAICELSKTYTFKNVGGTSAGAIAAALTAAAEVGRGKPGAGFEELARLPDWLGATAPGTKISNLNALFQPQARTRAAFELLGVLLGRGEPKNDKPRRDLSRLGPALFALWKHYPLWPALGIGISILMVGWAALHCYGWGILWAVLKDLPFIASLLLLGTLGAGIQAWFSTLAGLEGNLFGLCLGWAPPEPNRPKHLTQWLSDQINITAGLDPAGRPLTFEDLWGGPTPIPDQGVKLQMMTTNVTLGRPYRLPFEEKGFLFDPQEFRKLFPPNVVNWMVAKSHEPTESPAHGHLRQLPESADLPVIVAARLSLSFPGLISAVPLHAVDYTREDAVNRVPQRCWFSDGGISSNFPVHFFDAVLPRWPTFAIDLRKFNIDRQTEPDAVWMPKDNSGGTQGAWNRFAEKHGKYHMAGFLGAIFQSMQNWMDNIQLEMPGYRDRIVHVCLEDDAGGLNLDMSKKVIQRLSDRGTRAGQMLIRHFTDPTGEMNLDNHRWIRMRNSMSVLQESLTGAAANYPYPAPGCMSYEKLLYRGDADLPKSYPWENDTQRDEAREAIGKLLALGDELAKRPDTFEGGAPKPRGLLRIMPRV